MRTVLPWLGSLFLCVHAATALAEAPVAERGYAFCTVTDTGSTPAKVWASPVMAIEYPGDDPAGFRRSLDLASEFLEAVQARGGQGAKNCNVTATLQEAAQLRAEAEAIWNKRTFMIKIGDWREVAWTPKPWAPTAAPASTTRYFLCSAMQTDLPDRIAISRSVASGIITREVPGARALEATFELNQAFSREFQAVVQAHGLPVQGSCSPYDSLAEAQYALQQQRKLMDGFNQKYTEVAWEPSTATAAAVLAEAPAAAPRTTPVANGVAHGYCQVTQVDDGGMIWASSVFPLQEPPATAYSEALATRFKARVTELGGRGDAACWLHPEGAAAANRMREHAKTEWTTRMFARPGDWREVDWPPQQVAAPPAATPLIAAPAAAMPSGAWGVHIEDLPQPLADVLGLASSRGAWVRQVAPGSAAEAAGLKVMDVILQVDGQTVTDAAHLVALTRRFDGGSQVPVQVWRKQQTQALVLTTPVATASPNPVATADSAARTNRYYCVAGISRSKPVENLETPVHEVAGNPADTAAMSALLADLLASLASTSPGWEPFPAPTCYPNDTMFAGESFCYASAMKRLKGLSQTAALFCNTSREGIDARVKDMHSIAAGVPAQSLAWPE